MNSGTGTTERTDVGAAVVFEAGRKRMRRCDFSTGKGDPGVDSLVRLPRSFLISEEGRA